MNKGGFMKRQNETRGTEELLQWHSAFYAGIQIELEAEEQYLQFENEHMLSSKPMQLDVLIIKKSKSRQIEKNIGRIFRTYNIVEYKSPKDYLSVDDFYKVYGYACFYKSDTGKTDEIKNEEITISFVCRREPRKLMTYLEKKQGRSIRKVEGGIYYISDALFQIQLIVQKQLTEENNLWLKSLTDDLRSRQETERLLRVYKKHEKDNLYQAIMNVIVRANEERFKVNNMCEALDEILEYHFKGKLEAGFQQGREEGMKVGLEEGRAEGRTQSLLSQIAKKIAKGKSVVQIADELEESEEIILPLYNQLLTEG